MASPRPLWKRLTGATLNYGLGSLLPQVLSFLLVPVFTAFLTPGDYGLLELAASLATVLVILMRLGMPGALTRYYFEYREGEALRNYVTSLAWFTIDHLKDLSCFQGAEYRPLLWRELLQEWGSREAAGASRFLDGGGDRG